MIALVIPWYLRKNGHNPPVGVYIAIMGAAAAYVTFRENLRPVEKSAWIVLITLCVFAEIRNLYVADAEQVAKFGKISDALDATKKRLSETASGINATATKLDKSIAKSQEQFEVTIGGVKENLSTATGGNSFAEFFASPNMGYGNPPTYPLFVSVYGKHPMRNVAAEIQTVSYSGDPEGVQKQIQSIHSIPLGSETILPGPRPLSERISPGEYLIRIVSANGWSNEQLSLKLNGRGELIQSYEVWKDGKVMVQVKDGKLITRRLPH